MQDLVHRLVAGTKRMALACVCVAFATAMGLGGCGGGGGGGGKDIEVMQDSGLPRFVYALEQGFGGDGDNNRYVSAYAVNRNTGVLSELDTSPITLANDLDTVCEFAAVPSGKSIYVLESRISGDSDLIGYDVDQTTGKLSKMTGSPFAVERDATSPKSHPLAMAIAPSGRFIYVVNGDYYIDTYIDVYGINEDGTITERKHSTQITSTYGVIAKFVPSGKFIYILHNGQINVYPVNPDTGEVGSATQSETLEIDGTYAVKMAIDSQGKYLYVGFRHYTPTPIPGAPGACKGYVQAYSIADSGTFVKVPSDPIATGDYCIESMAIDPFDRYVYVGSQLQEEIRTYGVAADGNFKDVGISIASTDVFDMAFDPSGRFVYGAADPDVSAYSVNPGTGELSEILGSPFRTRSQKVAGGFSIILLTTHP